MFNYYESGHIAAHPYSVSNSCWSEVTGRTRMARNFVILVQLLLLAFVLNVKAQTVPEIKRRVTDLSGTLSSGEIEELNEYLAHFETETSNQIVVYFVSSLEGESLEDFSFRIAEQNHIGQKDRNNGVLLFIAKEEKKIRIEVGYGLEGALPDATSDQIIRHIIVPRFRQGDYYGGIRAGVEAIVAATKGEFKGTGERKNKNIAAWFILAGIFIAIILSFFGNRGGGFMVGSRGYRSTPYIPYGGFGGGRSSGGFGGGGFSGGGGSFGGGGASGGW